MFITNKQRKKYSSQRILVVLLIFGLNACRTAPIYNAIHIPISPRPSATDEEIEKTIWYAGRRLDWRISKVHSGELHGVFRKREHSATVAIPYNKMQFSILYLDSENLDYDDDEIHVNYNIWIKRLAEQIQNEINFRLP